MLTLDKLRDYGANVDEGLSRCFGKEAFYLQLVGMGLGDSNFDKLTAAVEAGNAADAFDAVHALKGAVGNLALTPLYKPVCELSDHLKGRLEMDGVPALYQNVMTALAEARALLD